MGDYDDVYDDKEEEKQEEEVVEFEDIRNVITERNKVIQQIGPLKKEYKENIGRLNLHLFGDPKNDEYISQLDRLEEEISHPMTKSHPMAPLAREVIRLVREIQLEYKKLNTLFSNSILEIGTLLDGSIKLYGKTIKAKAKENQELKDTIEECKIEIKSHTQMEEADKKITKDMVNEFMENGGTEALDRYKAVASENDKMKSMSLKSVFMRRAKDFFINKHPDPKRVGDMLFNKLTGRLEVKPEHTHKKNILGNSPKIGEEPIQSHSDPLKESRNSVVSDKETRNSVAADDEKGDESRNSVALEENDEEKPTV